MSVRTRRGERKERKSRSTHGPREDMDDGRVLVKVVEVAERDRVGRERAHLRHERVLDRWVPAGDNLEGRAVGRRAVADGQSGERVVSKEEEDAETHLVSTSGRIQPFSSATSAKPMTTSSSASASAVCSRLS